MTEFFATHHLHYRPYHGAQQLFLEDLCCEQLAECYGTPTFFYSKRSIVEQMQRYQQGLSARPYRINYAVKANSNIHILRLIRELGGDFDVVSGGEIQRVLKAGGSYDQITFSGVGKSIGEIQQAILGRTHSINIESQAELERISEIATQLRIKANVSLRVNPNINPQTHPYISTGLSKNKFGIHSSQVIDLYQRIAKQPWLNPVGISCHIGSQIFDLSSLHESTLRIVEFAEQLQQQGIALNFIDMGGGIGIPYDQQQARQVIDWESLFTFLTKNVPEQFEIHLEPGRSIVGSSGLLLSRVEYLKDDGQHRFAIIDAAMNDLIRPALYQAEHDIIACKMDAKLTATNWQIVGPCVRKCGLFTCQLCLSD